MNRTAAAHAARGSRFLIESLSKLSILGSSVGPGRSPSGVFFSDISVSTSSFAPAPPLLRPAGVSSSPAVRGARLPLRGADPAPEVDWGASRRGFAFPKDARSTARGSLSYYSLLITLLSKLAILVVDGGGLEYHSMAHSLAPAPLHSPGGSVLPSTPGPSLLRHQRSDVGS